MISTFPAPVLAIAADAVRDLEGGEALSGLWKCKSQSILAELRVLFLICPPSVHKVQRIFAGWPAPREHLLAYVVS